MDSPSIEDILLRDVELPFEVQMMLTASSILDAEKPEVVEHYMQMQVRLLVFVRKALASVS
jgi:hypothetical protein